MDTHIQQIHSLEEQAKQEIDHSTTQATLEEVRVRFLGTQGELNAITRNLPNLSATDKPKVGQELNRVKKEIEAALGKKQALLVKQTFTPSEWFDVTVPGIKPKAGQLHPLTKIVQEVTEIFRYLGFSVAFGPEVEWDEINFQKLRLYPDHPSRDTQETYYFDEKRLLRVHTSSVQIRYMESHKPPIRIISPGRVYRRDRIDATHLPMFNQIEGLLVDDQTKLTDLLGTLSFFVKRLFGEDRNVRFYGHHFPYTEPSLEVEVQSQVTAVGQSQVPSGTWLEILGCGMVHPEVLENCGINSKKYRGWAFGMGADRLAMLKYGISDIRALYEGDVRFLNQ